MGILGFCRVLFGPFWDHFGIILGLFLDHLGTLIIFIYFDLFWPMGTYCDIWRPILTLNWVCLPLHLLLLKRGLKAPKRARRALGAQRAPQPSTGARRRGAKRPKLLVFDKGSILAFGNQNRQHLLELYNTASNIWKTNSGGRLWGTL